MTSGLAVIAPDASVDELRRAFASGDTVVIGEPGTSTEWAIDALVAVLATSNAGSASPVPLATQATATRYETHPASPPPPTLALPCRTLCAFDGTALASLPPLGDGAHSFEELVVRTGERLLQHGWRHVAAPGIAFAWDPAATSYITPVGGWNERALRSQVGPANPGLEAHRSWAASQCDGVRVAIDGACLAAEPYTGTQHLVVEIARWLSITRPSASVSLAVRRPVRSAVAATLADTTVDVVERTTELDVDVVYRPYQMLFANELDFVLDVGRRGIVGQLDMIGFANPFYHPSEQLHSFARNIQRHLMRVLDGVTFISAFGRDSAFAECPDLDPSRLHVVSCGADPQVQPGALNGDRSLQNGDPFVVCLSSTFWHKNRAHAISTFEALATKYGYPGSLVIGGPAPYFGRSTEAEDDVLAKMPEDVRDRVHRWGHISDSEKWWLLANAQAVLYPSVVEGFGLVPFEAAAAGTPCLAFAGTAPGEMLASTTAVVDSFDPVVWAEQLDRLINETGASGRLVDEVIEVAARHTWRLCADRTWVAIDHALAAPRRMRHSEDGTPMSRIVPAADVHVPGATIRFNLARTGPAIARRLRRAVASLRDRRTS